MIIELKDDRVAALQQRSRNMGLKGVSSPVGEIQEMKKDINELKEQMKEILILLKQKGIKL